MSINLFIIGPSGSGKSTQAQLIADKYGLTHISTGQLFRDEIAQRTPLGLEAKKFIDQGIWCPDEMVLKILFSALNKVGNKNFIVDGTPRLPGQTQPIEDYLATFNQQVTALIHINVTFREILLRRQKSGQSFQDKDRTDNSPQAIQKRQEEYQKYLNPILNFYIARNQLIEIDGNRPIEPIFTDICQKLDTLLIKLQGKQ